MYHHLTISQFFAELETLQSSDGRDGIDQAYLPLAIIVVFDDLGYSL